MADDQLKSAKLLKRKVLSMIHARQSEIKELQKQFNELEKIVDNNLQVNVKSGDKAVQYKNKKNDSKEDIAQTALKLVKMRDEPIMRDELYDLLIAHGMKIDGKNPKMILSTMLWRVKNSGLVRLSGGGYWLKDKRYDPANYSPDNPKPTDAGVKQMEFQELDI